MADDDCTLRDQLAAALAIDREGCHARVDLPGRDRLSEQIATCRRSSNAIRPACRNPEVAAVGVRAEEWSKVFAGMDVPCPLTQDSQISETRHRFDEVPSVMGDHG